MFLKWQDHLGEWFSADHMDDIVLHLTESLGKESSLTDRIIGEEGGGVV